MEKMKRTAKHLDTLFKIVHTCCSIAAVAALVCLGIIAAALLFRLDPDRIGTGYSSIEVGFLSLDIAPAYSPAPYSVLLQTAVGLGFGFVLALVSRRAVSCLRRILEPMTRGEPFHSLVGQNIGTLAKLSIVIGVLLNAVKLSSQIMTVFLLDLPALLVSEKITHVSGNFTFDLSFLVISALLFLLSYIFRYGEQLQQLSDETL